MGWLDEALARLPGPDITAPAAVRARADDILRPDEAMTEELRTMSAALNRVGNNVISPCHDCRHLRRRFIVTRAENRARVDGDHLVYLGGLHIYPQHRVIGVIKKRTMSLQNCLLKGRINVRNTEWRLNVMAA